jgi:acetolactate synthase-1/2/3 large subunit
MPPYKEWPDDKGLHTGWFAGQVLAENGIDKMFGFHGGHNWSFIIGGCQHGIPFYQFRFEAGAGYAAEAYARCTRRPAALTVTAGPGMGNAVEAVMQAWDARSPLVVLLGQHPMREDGMGSLQEGYGELVYKTFTKYAKRVVDRRMVPREVKKALQIAYTWPYGPVAIEVPVDNLNRRDLNMETVKQWGNYSPNEPVLKSMPGGSPEEIEKACEILLKSKRPTILAGDGLYYSCAEEEIKELVELAKIPISCRRQSRGMVPETHPLSYFTGEERRHILPFADTVVTIGIRFTYLEAFGAYCKRAENVIQINESPLEIDYSVPNVKHAVVGHPKTVIRQMIEYFKANQSRIQRDEAWISRVAEAKQIRKEANLKEMERARKKDTIHPALLSQEIADFLDDSATLIADSFTGSEYMSDKIYTKFGGQIFTANETGNVGHGIGMAIGCQLARPGRQILSNMGDGGFGCAGMDVETAARYNLPVVYVVHNNGAAIGQLEEVYYSKMLGLTGSRLSFNDELRYDKMFESVGVHGELVETKDQIRPALYRAFNSGKTAIINVKIAKDVVMRASFMGPDTPGFYGFIEPDEIASDEGRKLCYGFPDIDLTDFLR